jgi:hypothetical protein
MTIVRLEEAPYSADPANDLPFSSTGNQWSLGRLGSLGTLGGLAYEQVQEQMVVDY